VADPVEQAEQALRLADLALSDARDALLHAKGVLLSTLNLPVQGILHGSLHQQDDFGAQALEEVDLCKRTYDAAWQQRASARVHLAQMEKAHREGQQQAWVAQHRPELVRNLHHWQEQLRTATTDRMHAEAKKNYALLQLAYQQEVATAPISVNEESP
jgi:hypothetical protein